MNGYHLNENIENIESKDLIKQINALMDLINVLNLRLESQENLSDQIKGSIENLESVMSKNIESIKNTNDVLFCFNDEIELLKSDFNIMRSKISNKAFVGKDLK